MIGHIVGWTFKPTVSERGRTSFNEGLFLGRRIPEARSFVLGTNRRASPGGFTDVYIAMFDDATTFRRFQESPVHASRAPFVEATERLLVMDVDDQGRHGSDYRPGAAYRALVWTFAEACGAGRRHQVLAGLGQLAGGPARALAVGPNLAFSQRFHGFTHLLIADLDRAETPDLERFDRALATTGVYDAASQATEFELPT